MKLEDQHSESEPSALNEPLPETNAKEAFREQILQRFAKWLDDVLAEEKPIEGIASELLAELSDGNASDAIGQTGSKCDLYSTWSAMTALTQEIKLQGRAFKHLSDKMAPLAGLGESIDRLLEANREAISEAKRIAEEGRGAYIERENNVKREGYDRRLRELIRVIIDIRHGLLIGLGSTGGSRRKLDEYRNSSWVKKIFIKKIALIHHMLEIVDSLKKGYRLSLDRLDEALQQLGVHEIECEGKPFDPRVMNAVDVEETVDAPDGMVLEVYRIGYMLDTDVLQPAQVKVARAPAQNIINRR